MHLQKNKNKQTNKKKNIYVCIYFNGFELQWIHLFI